MRGVRIEGTPPQDWIEDAKSVTQELMAAEATSIDASAYSLQLAPNLTNKSELPKVGTSLLVVGVVNEKIHVRVFDDGSTQFVDAEQPKRDYATSLYNQLSELLKDNWDRDGLKPLEVQEVFRIAATIARRFLTNAIIERKQALWRDDRVRNWLLAQFNNKCWYSEARDSVSSIHVDHFRPKGRVSDEKSKEVCEGYWWLAFDWTNYRIGGELLNVKKSDIFPFSDASRATHDDADSLRKECPVLLDPRDEDQARLISYDLQDEETCVAVLAADISPEEAERAQRTIEILGLNRLPRLNSKRADFWEQCKMAIADYVGATGPSCFSMIEKTKARIALEKMVKYDSEFSSVSEACIRKNAPKPLEAAVFSQ